MNCRQCVEFLDDYFDGRLPEQQRAIFEEHLSCCPPCVTYLETYQRSIRITVTISQQPDQPKEAMPEALVRAILQAQRAGTSPPPPPTEC